MIAVLHQIRQPVGPYEFYYKTQSIGATPATWTNKAELVYHKTSQIGGQEQKL